MQIHVTVNADSETRREQKFSTVIKYYITENIYVFMGNLKKF